MRIGLRWGGAALLALVAGPSLAAAQGAPAAPQTEAAAPATPAPQPPRPAIWLLADADTKIYLFGTFHILPRGFEWRSPLFNDIARRADELVIEVSDQNMAETRAAVLAQLALGKQAPILWRVSHGRRQALQELVDNIGVPIEQFDGMQTWAVAMGLAATQIVRHYSGQDEAAPSLAQVPGVEVPLEAEFRASRRPVSGVETAVQQMSFFGTLSFAEQRGLLEAMIDAYRFGGEKFAEGQVSEGDWARGDVEAIAAAAETMRGPLYEVLLRRRNAAWSQWLAARLERPGTLLFAVGAAHLAGPDSVQRMLDARGLRAQRIQ